jgi:hypothetical protein
MTAVSAFSRFQEAGKIRALAQLRDAQLNGAGPGLPIPLAIAVALGQALGALLAIAGPGQATHLQLHQALGRKADHLAQEIGIGALLQESPQVHHLVGHLWSLVQVGCRNPTLPGTADDHPRSRPPATALSRARRQSAPLPSSYTIPRDTTLGSACGGPRALGTLSLQ